MKNSIHVFSAQISTWGRKIGRSRFVWRTFQRQMVKRILRRNLRLCLSNGRTIWLPHDSAFSSVAWIMNGLVDDGSETVLHALHPAGTVFCDVGAHFGFYAVWMCDVASKVYAVEPDPRMHAALNLNLGAQSNCAVVPVALTRESGRVAFIQAESAPHSKIGGAADHALAGKRIEVAALSLDDLWRREGRPAIGSMKMDTEGHEVAVYAGGRSCIEACRPLILVETDGDALREYWPFFETLGYRLGFLSEKVSGRPTSCWFGRMGDFQFAGGMLFLVPATIREAQFRAEVERL